MKLWTWIKIVTPIALAFASVMFPNNQKALIVSACVASIFSIITFLSNSSLQKQFLSKTKLLHRLQSNQKRALVHHINEPHIISTATIDITTNPPLLVESYNVSDVVDCGVGDFRILVDIPFSTHLVPRVESDIPFTPAVQVSDCKSFTSIEVKWEKTEPRMIYFSLSSRANHANV